ncbi:MAG: hypothetical protein DMF64_09140 [Acidobacteria bacterium]|nr:MAG: hypothetical protein DMF64_09140 [Acidobacteriota bacterium]
MNLLLRAYALGLASGWLQSLTSRVTSHVSGRGVAWGVGLSVFTFVASIVVTVVVLVKLPADYFSRTHPHDFFSGRSQTVRVAGTIIKNLLGAILFVLGVVMSLPGVPGQGILTILLGVMLLDIPGKRKLEIKIVSRPKVLRTINRIRARYHKPPLELD